MPDGFGQNRSGSTATTARPTARSVNATIRTCAAETVTGNTPAPARVKRSVSTGASQRSRAPWSSRTNSCRNTEAPIAAISGTWVGVPRRGRKTSRSTAHPCPAVIPAAISSTTGSAHAPAPDHDDQRNGGDHGLVSPQHQQLAEGEVDPPDDAVDQREPDRQQRIDAPQHGPVQGLLEHIKGPRHRPNRPPGPTAAPRPGTGRTGPTSSASQRFSQNRRISGSKPSRLVATRTSSSGAFSTRRAENRQFTHRSTPSGVL